MFVTICKLPKSTQLSESGKGKILAFRECRLSGCDISTRVNRSKTVVYSFLKNPGQYGNKKHLGRLASATPCQVSAVVRRACLKKQTSNHINQDMQLPCTSRTVCNVLSRDPNVKFSKVKARPPFTKQHKMKRINLPKSTLLLALSVKMWSFPMKRGSI